MIRRRLNTLNFVLRVVTFLLPLLAFLTAAYVRFFSGLIPLRTTDISVADYVGLLFFTTVVWALVVDHYKLFSFDHLYVGADSGKMVFWACCVTYIAVMSATFFYRSVSFSRLFVTISGLVLLIIALLSERGFKALRDRARERAGGAARILIVGADQFALETAGKIISRMPLPTVVAGFVRLDGQEVVATEAPVFELQDLKGLTWGHEIDDIVLALPAVRFSEIPGILAQLEHLCLPVRAVLDLGANVLTREMLFDFGGLRLLDLRSSPSESTVYMIAKRAFDFVISAIALIVLSPVIAIVAIAVRLTSPGPALFVQERVGLNGRLFRMYKFRTMRVTNLEESDKRWTIAEDPRRTKLGVFLRRTNLDELPQFFNVLRGEMSIVGPRPERPHFVQKFLTDVAQYNNRHYLKVGITGWAQVNGWRGDTSIARRIEHDLYYLRNWSLTLDLKIILLTVFRTFATNKNAY
jgi:Undecaprenyl-phosphate glucose phosphotransferase